MNSACKLFAAAIAALAASAAPAAPQPAFLRPDMGIFGNRVALGCAIERVKVWVVTNTTAGPIAAGTTMHVDILHFPTGTHEVLTYQSPAMAVGAVLRDGTYLATSCTAWIEVPMTLAPSGAPPPPTGPAAPLGDRPLLLMP